MDKGRGVEPMRTFYEQEEGQIFAIVADIFYAELLDLCEFIALLNFLNL